MIISKQYYPLNAFRICVDKIEDDIQGKSYSPLCAQEITFAGIGELLVKMDELFDQVGYPQAFQDKRSFDERKEITNLYKGIPKTELTADRITGKKGKIKTFDILIISRKNASWQGELYDETGTYYKNFDGEIQLLTSIV